MLETGWPIDTPGEPGATALHRAGFNGNAEMTREILRFHPALELKSREYEGTALGGPATGPGTVGIETQGISSGRSEPCWGGRGGTVECGESQPGAAVLEVLR
jgi:hypothetical protein